MKIIMQWPLIMGSLHTKVCVEKIKGSTLFLTATDSCWLTELYMLSPFIIKKINSVFEEPRITHVRFSLKSTTQLTSYTKKCNVKPLRVSYTISCSEKEALVNIKDEKMREVLERFLKRCKYEQTR